MAETKAGPNGANRLAGQLQPAQPGGFYELGTTGLQRWSGYISEEFHRELTGDRALRVYREMMDNSATVGACLFAIDMLARNVTWHVEAGGKSPEDEDAALFVEQCREDMSHSWQDLMSEILTMLGYGWSYHELVYKRRQGPNSQPGLASRFTDGRIGWRKIPIRSQETRQRWEFDPGGGITGLWQQDPVAYQTVLIPIQKSLLFRPRAHKNNPEGRSCLRTAYRPWYFSKRIEEIEGVGVERDLAGLPVIFAPPELFRSDRVAEQSSLYIALQNIVRNIRRDEQEGVLMPMAYDAQGKPLYDLKLLSTGGQRQFNTNEVIQRYNQQIAMTMLADFILLGHEKVGSFALASSKTSLFSSALGAWLDGIAEVFNRHAIPRLLGLNGFQLETLPKLMHGDVETVDLIELGNFITALSGAGFPLFPDFDLENWIRTQAGWSNVTQEQWDERQAEAQTQRDQQTKDIQAQELLQTQRDQMDRPVQEPGLTMKYDPGQPRHPAGHEQGGQWEGGGDAGSATQGVDAQQAEALANKLKEVSRRGAKIMLESGFKEGTLEDYRALTHAANQRGIGELEELAGRGKRENVPLADLVDTQGIVQRDALVRNLQMPSTKPILVARLGGQLYIVDGHHRATAARLRGLKDIAAEVIDLGTQ